MRTTTEWYPTQPQALEEIQAMEQLGVWAVRQIIATLWGGYIVVFESESESESP